MSSPPNAHDDDNAKSSDALQLYKDNKYREALPGLTKLEESGSLEARFYLAYMYQEGLGVSQNYEYALERYRSLASEGSAVSSFYAGSLLERLGRMQESIDLYRVAAEGGNISAAYALYRLGSTGKVEKISREDSERLFKQALDGGHFYAKRDLVHSMLRGKYGVAGFFKAIPMFMSGFFGMANVIANDPKNPKLY